MFMCAPSVKLKFQRFDEATMSETKCILKTNLRFFGCRILLEGTADPAFNDALRRLFVKDFNKSGPLNVTDPDCQTCLRGPIQQGLLEVTDDAGRD